MLVKLEKVADVVDDDDDAAPLQMIMLVKSPCARPAAENVGQYAVTRCWSTLNWSTLNWSTLNWSTLHFSTLHFSTLHFSTLRSSTLLLRAAVPCCIRSICRVERKVGVDC
jgi:hypothetical protein